MKSSETKGLKSVLYNLFIYDWKKKAVALFLAVFLWYYVDSLEYTEQTVSLPVQFVNIPSNKMVIDTWDRSVGLEIKARKNVMKNPINFSKVIKATVNLSNAQVGMNDYRIEITLLDPKLDLKIKALKDNITLKIDDVDNKVVRVSPRIIGELPQGYVLVDTKIDISTVAVKGPSQNLKDVRELETEPILLYTLSNSITQTLALRTPMFIQTIGRDSVVVQVLIRESIQNKEMYLPVRFENVPQGFKPLDDAKVFVYASVPAKFLSSYTNEIVLRADCAKVTKAGSYYLKLEAESPQEIRIQSVSRFVNVEFLEIQKTNQ